MPDGDTAVGRGPVPTDVGPRAPDRHQQRHRHRVDDVRAGRYEHTPPDRPGRLDGPGERGGVVGPTVADRAVVTDVDSRAIVRCRDTGCRCRTGPVGGRRVGGGPVGGTSRSDGGSDRRGTGRGDARRADQQESATRTGRSLGEGIGHGVRVHERG
ncbi:hypothetical protein SZ60_14210 [Frigoribacterium sp. MEB024]|nr:hypothetical protein SZ60_14210 [Frigoribacterium sp. MEB024]